MISPGLERLLVCYVAVVSLIVLSPLVVVVMESFTETSFVVFPPQGFSLQWYERFLNHRELMESFVISVVVALCTALVGTVLAFGASVALVRSKFRGAMLAEAFLMAPFSLPTLVIGLALLQFLAGNGIARSPAMLVCGHIVITLPFAIRFISVALMTVDPALERASQSLGASPLKTFWLVTVPLARSGIVSSFIFLLVLSFDDVAVSLFLANAQAVTLPVRLYLYIDTSYDPLVTAVSSVLIFASLLGMAAIERLVGISRFFGLKDTASDQDR